VARLDPFVAPDFQPAEPLHYRSFFERGIALRLTLANLAIRRKREGESTRAEWRSLLAIELSTTIDFRSWLSIQRALNYLFMIRPIHRSIAFISPAEFHAQMYAAAIRTGDGFYGVNFQMQSCMSANGVRRGNNRGC